MKGSICFFNSNRNWGGGEKWHFDMCTRLKKEGYRTIIASDEEGELAKRARMAGVTLYPVSISNLSMLNPFKILALSRFMRGENVETIILNLPADLKVAGIAAHHADVEKVIYRRGLAKPVRNTILNRYLLRRIATQVITNSLETKRLLLAHNPLIVEEDKIRVIYNGIDLEQFDNTPSEALYARREGEAVLGSAGRLVKQKGQQHLIEIASQLKGRGIKFKMMIAGEGELKEQLQRYAEKMGVGNETIFTGFVHNMKAFMESIDIFLLTSLWEGFGYAIVEAMACRKPVVAFNVSSNPEIISHMKTGYLIDHMSIDDFAEKTVSLIGDPELRRRFGEEGRRKVESDFSLERTVRELEKAIG